MIVIKQLDQGICPSSTSKKDTMLNNMRTKCIRKDHPLRANQMNKQIRKRNISKETQLFTSLALSCGVWKNSCSPGFIFESFRFKYGSIDLYWA